METPKISIEKSPRSFHSTPFLLTVPAAARFMASPSSVHQQLQEAQQANAALKMNDTIQLTSVGEFQAAGYKLDSHCLYSVVEFRWW